MTKKRKTQRASRQELVLYQAKSGQIEFRGDFEHETIWGSIPQIAALFGVQNPAISKHLANIYDEGELERVTTVSKMETVQMEGKREVKRQIEYYNLDAILSVGYRVNSKQATQFRIWATKTLKQHILHGYTINKKRVAYNYEQFLRAVSDVKALLPVGGRIHAQDVLELVNAFASTWFSLDAYDTQRFPKKGITKKQVTVTADELSQVLENFKEELRAQKQATALFGQERSERAIQGIVGNVFQTFGGKELYQTVEEKAAHLLYFIVKNHPFTDGNKRSGALAFVWFLRKAGVLRASLTPEALTALTLLVAESDAAEKDKMTGLVLLLLQK